MSVATRNAERAKYTYLLRLAQEQIRALETDDMHTFDQIIASKRVLIEGLVDAHAMLMADPTLGSVVRQIQDYDKTAERLLYRKVGRIMREMAELQQFKKARHAYRKSGAYSSSLPAGFTQGTPMFVDRKS